MNNRGEVIAPFIEALPEEARSAIPEDIAKDPAFASFKDIKDVFAAAKTGSKPWFDNLPDDVKADPNVSKYKTAEEFARGHQSVVKLVGQKGVIIPKDDAPQAEKDAFLNTLGRPEKPEGYKFTPVEGLHPSIKVTPESEAWYRGLAHKAGLTQAQADMVNSEYMKATNAAIMQREGVEQKELDTAITELRREWLQDYDVNLKMVNRFIAKFGPKDAIDHFNGRDPVVLKTLANAAKLMSEDNIAKFGASDLSANAGQVKSQIKEITERILKTDTSAPEYNQLVEQRTKLYEILAEQNQDA
jgi:hypothetical protein